MRKVRRILSAGIVAAALWTITPPMPARAVTEIPVLTTLAGEFQPARGTNHLAWEQNSRKQPRHYDVFVSPDGGTATQVNRGRSNAAMGGLDGQRLVYQRFRKQRSNLVFYDLGTGQSSPAPKSVNTPQWEYWPSISHPWLLFARLYGNGTRRLILFNLDSGERRVLDKTRRENAFIGPGQVNGNYAAWSICTPQCSVVRYNIAANSKEKIPGGGYERAPSVTPGGTLYFSRGGKHCGSPVSLVKSPLAGPEVVLVKLQDVLQILDTYVYTEPNGTIEVFYERSGCTRRTASDIYKIRDTAVATLTVSKEGSGSGAVISSPPGVACGGDCIEDYETGTTVTLEVFPSENSLFAGWTGECTGMDGCVVTMDASKSVTATFASIGPTTGTVIVAKQTNPDGAPGSFTFTGTPSGTISDDQTLSRNVLPGTYTSTEDTALGFSLVKIECSDANSSGDTSTRMATFHVHAGETVTCTFTNSSTAPA